MSFDDDPKYCETENAYEYFCPACGQFRLGLRKFSGCGECGNTEDIIFGSVGELNSKALKEDWQLAKDTAEALAKSLIGDLL